MSNEILLLLSALLGGGFVTAAIRLYHARPQKDSVIVSSAQGAAKILQGVNSALYTELDRARAEAERERAERIRLESLLQAQRQEDVADALEHTRGEDESYRTKRLKEHEEENPEG